MKHDEDVRTVVFFRHPYRAAEEDDAVSAKRRFVLKEFAARGHRIISGFVESAPNGIAEGMGRSRMTLRKAFVEVARLEEEGFPIFLAIVRMESGECRMADDDEDCAALEQAYFRPRIETEEPEENPLEIEFYTFIATDGSQELRWRLEARTTDFFASCPCCKCAALT